MRKFSVVLAVLLFTAPVWATVTITCTPTANPDTVLISYSVVPNVDEPNKVRAFALDITVDKGAVITDVNDSVSAYYNIYPGSIVIVDNAIDDLGTADANREDWDEGSPQYLNTGPGKDSNWVTVEMGALYYPTNDSSPNAPPLADNLLKVTVGGATPGCMLCIKENEIRGGVVLTDPSIDPTVIAPCYSVVQETVSKPGIPVASNNPQGTPCGNIRALVNQLETYTTTGSTCNYGHTVEYQFDWGDGTQSIWSATKSASKTWAATAIRNIFVTAHCQVNPAITNTSDTRQIEVMPDCFPVGNLRRNDWIKVCYPKCWCGTAVTPNWKFQCDGDADGTTETMSKFRVATNDLNKLVAAWKTKASDMVALPDSACADFDHKSETMSLFRVATNDLNRLVAHWKWKDSQLPGNCPRNE